MTSRISKYNVLLILILPWLNAAWNRFSSFLCLTLYTVTLLIEGSNCNFPTPWKWADWWSAAVFDQNKSDIMFIQNLGFKKSYWIGQKFHLHFFITSYGKTWTNLLANPYMPLLSFSIRLAWVCFHSIAEGVEEGGRKGGTPCKGELRLS